MLYHKTKDILATKEKLGHKNIVNTQIYVSLDATLFEGTDDFAAQVARTIDDACKLVEVGFEHVTEIDGAKIFRKRK